MPVPMKKLRVATFHHYIIVGGTAAYFFVTGLGHLWLDMPTNLHVRFAKKSADILSFCISFYYYLYLQQYIAMVSIIFWNYVISLCLIIALTIYNVMGHFQIAVSS